VSELPTRDSLPLAEQPLPRDYRRNAFCFFSESSLFMIGMSLVSTTTVLPPLIERLSGSTVVVGAAGALFNGLWLLPQVFVAGAISGLDRKKPVMVAAIWASRVPYLLTGLFLAWFGDRSATANLAAVLLCVGLFHLTDAVAAVPWFDLVARAIPANRRGRVFGASEVLGGLGGVATGFVVRYALGDASPWRYPTNYAVLFLGAGIVLEIGAVFLTLIREPHSTLPADGHPSARQMLGRIPGILVRDKPFRQMVLTRLALGFVGLASAFYVLHATQRIGLAPQDIGYFVSAQVVGGLAAGLLTSVVQDRYGPRAHIRVAAMLALFPAVIGLLGEPLALLLGGGVFFVYLVLFFLLGMSTGSAAWPFFNWTMEYAPEDQRPSYMGLLNTLGGLYMLAPLLGGWVVKVVSYQAAFALALGCGVLSLLLSRGLPSTRTTTHTK